MNKSRLAKINPHMVDLLVLKRDEEDEVPGSQIGAGDRGATAGLIQGSAGKSDARDCQVEPGGQRGAVDARSIRTAFAVFDPQPMFGFSAPGSRGNGLARVIRR